MYQHINTITSINTKRDTIAAFFLGRAKVVAKLIILFVGFAGISVGLYFSYLLISKPVLSIYIDGRPWKVGSLLLALLLIYGIWLIASGRKKIVLYLRRFNDSLSNEAMTRAMYSSLRGIARVVVLDDGMYRAVSLPSRERILGLLTWIPFFFMIVYTIGIGSVIGSDLVTDESPTLYFSATVNCIERSALVPEADSITSFIAVIPTAQPNTFHTQFLEGSLLTSFPIAILTWCVLLVMAVPLWRYIFAFAEAQRSITGEVDANRLVRRTRYLKGWIAAPKAFGNLATVARSSNLLWQHVVSQLAAESDVIVLDISTPSDSILWELQLCAEKYPHKLLIMINEEANKQIPSLASEMLILKINQTIRKSGQLGALLWDTTTATSRRSFTRNLRRFITLCKFDKSNQETSVAREL